MTKRLDLGLRQKDIAKQINGNNATIGNRERNTRKPKIHQMPRLITFIGFCPRQYLDATLEEACCLAKLLRT